MPGGPQRWSIYIKDRKCYVAVNGKPLSKKQLEFLDTTSAEAVEFKGMKAIKVNCRCSVFILAER
jgi:hypothetical protein